MNELIFTQHWLVPNLLPEVGPMEPEVLFAKLLITCDNGADFLVTFEAPEIDSFMIEVPEGTVCYLRHSIPSSAVETESTCGESVQGNIECIYTSVVFNESVPTLNLVGIIVAIVMMATVALVAVRKYA